MSAPVQDVVVVGAPRSGTNMLRDVIVSLDGAGTWPCDEINLIWRHGNRDADTDELSAEMARPEVARYVRRQFDRARRRYDAPTLVEKTCATSLRPAFTRAVLPDARYVLIVRDGIDAAASAVDRWHAPLDLRYTAAKARFVPRGDLPHYAARFVRQRLQRRGGSAERVGGWWGPKPHDYRRLMAEHDLEAVCAVQWQRCVETAERGLADLPADRLLRVRYERFVTDPRAEAARVADFLGLPGDLDAAVATVSASSVGRGRQRLGDEAASRLEDLLGPSLDRVRREIGRA